MKKKIIKIILISCVLVLVFFFDTYQKESENQNTVSVVQFKEPYKKDYYLNKEDLKMVTLPDENFQSNMVLETSFEAGFLKRDVYQNTFLYKELLSDEPSFKLKKNQRLITVKCSILESNGWFSQVSDFVDIVMVADTEEYIINNAKVLRRFDQNLSSEGLPEYYTFIVTLTDARAYFEKLKSSDVYILVK